MLVDIAFPGWVPFYSLNLGEDVPGYIDTAARALAYPWKHLIGGHMGRLGTREDVVLHQQYIADMVANCKTALNSVDPTPCFQKYDNNNWAAVRAYLDAVTDAAAAPVIQSTPACWARRTCLPPATRSRSWSRYASTKATAAGFTRELLP